MSHLARCRVCAVSLALGKDGRADGEQIHRPTRPGPRAGSGGSAQLGTPCAGAQQAAGAVRAAQASGEAVLPPARAPGA